ncbi:MAG TPA: M20/M25/M40 family metallo-hydrolase [Candidatus Acidoferrum sp.]|nr:M20/M25/M40 family metallo-hydrolase [Candidatus Acidoferrum sp.]
MTRKNLVAVFVLAALLLAPRLARAGSGTDSPAIDEGTLKGLTAVAGEGMMQSHAYEYLEELSDDIGARVTGSEQDKQAEQWGLAKMKAIGLENVHLEPWNISRGWTRVSADAELIAPIQRKLDVDSMGWVGSTPPGGVEATVIPVNVYQLDEEMSDHAANWRGKILLAVRRGEKPKDSFSTFLKFGEFLRTAQKAGALAVIGGQGGSQPAGMHLTHTGALGFDTYFEIPVVSMAAEDQAQLERYIDRGKTIELRLNVQNRVTDHPVESANVIGEIRGAEHPEQIVVVGGHLDSWDLATGTTDNGCGTTTTLAAAEAIIKSGIKPKRTIRFILFTGEEEGLLGSQAYVRDHKKEMANHVAAVILDEGQGAVKGLQLGGRNDLVDTVTPFAQALQAFGDLKVDDATEFGTDTGSFILQGLPGINLDQDTTDYRFTHHSAVDTFDKVQADILDRNATIMALTAFWIADRPDRLASPWPPEKTAQMLIDKHDDTFLKAFGLWPFGNLGQSN